jgi:hypothetical protein
MLQEYSSPNFGVQEMQEVEDLMYNSPPISQDLLKKHNNFNAVASDLQVKESQMPLHALYNPVLDRFKQAERDIESEPTPLTVVIMKDKKSQDIQYQMYNEERGIKLEYRPSIHGHSKSHVHTTGKVIWINNNAGQKASPYTRKELLN